MGAHRSALRRHDDRLFGGRGKRPAVAASWRPKYLGVRLSVILHGTIAKLTHDGAITSVRLCGDVSPNAEVKDMSDHFSALSVTALPGFSSKERNSVPQQAEDCFAYPLSEQQTSGKLSRGCMIDSPELLQDRSSVQRGRSSIIEENPSNVNPTPAQFWVALLHLLEVLTCEANSAFREKLTRCNFAGRAEVIVSLIKSGFERSSSEAWLHARFGFRQLMRPSAFSDVTKSSLDMAISCLASEPRSPVDFRLLNGVAFLAEQAFPELTFRLSRNCDSAGQQYLKKLGLGTKTDSIAWIHNLRLACKDSQPKDISNFVFNHLRGLINHPNNHDLSQPYILWSILRLAECSAAFCRPASFVSAETLSGALLRLRSFAQALHPQSPASEQHPLQQTLERVWQASAQNALPLLIKEWEEAGLTKVQIFQLLTSAATLADVDRFSKIGYEEQGALKAIWTKTPFSTESSPGALFLRTAAGRLLNELTPNYAHWSENDPTILVAKVEEALKKKKLPSEILRDGSPQWTHAPMFHLIDILETAFYFPDEYLRLMGICHLFEAILAETSPAQQESLVASKTSRDFRDHLFRVLSEDEDYEQATILVSQKTNVSVLARLYLAVLAVKLNEAETRSSPTESSSQLPECSGGPALYSQVLSRTGCLSSQSAQLERPFRLRRWAEQETPHWKVDSKRL